MEIQMNKMMISVFIRQIIARSLYLSPFWLAYIYIHTPFNILAACLLIIRQKLPSDTDMYELQVLMKQTALILIRNGTDEDRENLERMKKAFTFGDEVLHEADVEGASAKFLVDSLFLVAEGLSIIAMIGWFIFS